MFEIVDRVVNEGTGYLQSSIGLYRMIVDSNYTTYSRYIVGESEQNSMLDFANYRSS